MKVILNGATCGTNFGDYLFAQTFQDRVSEKLGKDNVYWYSSRYALSDFYADNLDNRKKYKLSEMDGMVCISGGYFCGDDRGFKDYVRRYLRYFLLADECILRRIPYAVIGVEVGFPRSKILRAIQKRILSHAAAVTVRNQQSLDCMEKMGLHNAVCTADTVFAMERSFFEDKELPDGLFDGAEKTLLLHVYPHEKKNGELIVPTVIPTVNAFVNAHPEYRVVLAADQDSKEQEAELERMASLIRGEVRTYKYCDPVALCKVIDKSDLIVTSKLHVGIVGARLGKSVVSFSDHSEKVSRLYAQLGEAERSVSLSDLTVDKGVRMLEKYCDTPITVPEEITEAALINLRTLDAFIDGLQSR